MNIAEILKAIDLSVLSIAALVDLYVIYHRAGERELANIFLQRLMDADLWEEESSNDE